MMDSTDLIFAMYGSRDSQTRTLALKFGSDHISDKKQFAELVKLALQDSEPGVRQEAQQTMDLVIEHLNLDSMLRNSGNAALRNSAISYLKENVISQESFLLKLLEDQDSDIILFATQIISSNPTPKLVNACLQNLFSLDTNIVQATIEVTVEAKEKKVIPLLHKILTHNIWNEMVILDALVKLGDPQVIFLLDERIKSKTEFTLMAFEIMKSNSSVKMLKLLVHNAVVMLTSKMKDDYLHTLVSVAFNCTPEYGELLEYSEEIRKNTLTLKLNLELNGKSEEVRIASGLLVIWGVLDGSNWNASEWLDMINSHENGPALRNVFAESDWRIIIDKLKQEPFSMAVFDFLVLNKPDLTEIYLTIHKNSIKHQLNSILSAMNGISLQIPDFLYPLIESDLSLLNPETVRNLVVVNPDLVCFYEKLLSQFGDDELLLECIFENASRLDPVPEVLENKIVEYSQSPDFQKRHLSVKGAFLEKGRDRRHMQITLLNDPVLEVRIEAYQYALEGGFFPLINELKISNFIDPIEVFYLSRFIGASSEKSHIELMEFLFEKSSGNLKDQIENTIRQMNNRIFEITKKSENT